MTAPPKPPPLPPSPAVPANTVRAAAPTRAAGHRIAIYGAGGVGKTTLASTAPGPVWFQDLDQSLGVLRLLDALALPEVGTWDQLRANLAAPGWDGVGTLVVDSATAAEELAVAWTLANVPSDKGGRCQRLEDYGYGKGYRHVYDTFLSLLADLDRHVRAGRNVILICHDCTSKVPNPAGEDYLRYEPLLQGGEKSSVRARVKNWADHLLYVGYDVAVDKGKARGSGTRTIWPIEMPFALAKSRTLTAPMELVQGATGLWDAMFKESH